MEMNSEDKSELTREILLGFHTQFAENQRSREQSFLRILTFLAVPVGAYAYVYHYFLIPNGELKIEINELYLIQGIATLLIFAGTWIVITISNNFRRDQFVIAKIRKECGLLGDEKIFPESYNPEVSLKSKGFIEWMPDFLQVFFYLFLSVQAFLGYVFCKTVNPICVGFNTHIDWTLTIVWILTVLLFIISLFFLPFIYRKKIIEVMKVDKDIYSLRQLYKLRIYNFCHRSKNTNDNKNTSI